MLQQWLIIASWLAVGLSCIRLLLILVFVSACAPTRRHWIQLLLTRVLLVLGFLGVVVCDCRGGVGWWSSLAWWVLVDLALVLAGWAQHFGVAGGASYLVILRWGSLLGIIIKVILVILSVARACLLTYDLHHLVLTTISWEKSSANLMTTALLAAVLLNVQLLVISFDLRLRRLIKVGWLPRLRLRLLHWLL
jgi:hypothetical protein